VIELSAEARAILTRSHDVHVSVESWRAGVLLADNIPIASGEEECDRGLRVPERVTLSVPRRDQGDNWTPAADDHPLAAYGQRLRVQLGVSVAGGEIEWLTRGWYLIRSSEAQGDTVTVEAVGLLALLDEARMIAPYRPGGASFASAVTGLAEPALTVDIDSALTGRTVPDNVNYGDDRLAALLEILDAWPAEAHVNPDGVLAAIQPVEDTTAAITLTDGTGGTVVQVDAASTREGAYNCVVARGATTDGKQVQGIKYDSGPGSTVYGGPFNPFPVPDFYDSPLITSVSQARAVAAWRMDLRRRQQTRAYVVETVPNPAIQTGDVVALVLGDLGTVPGRVERLTLPYTASQGAQRLQVRSVR
jgi:hypothetical protein